MKTTKNLLFKMTVLNNALKIESTIIANKTKTVLNQKCSFKFQNLPLFA